MLSFRSRKRLDGGRHRKSMKSSISC